MNRIYFELVLITGSFVAGCLYKQWALAKLARAYAAARDEYVRVAAELKSKL